MTDTTKPAHNNTPTGDARPPAAGDIPCPQCGHPMHGVRGSRLAICANCGFKDACCY